MTKFHAWFHPFPCNTMAYREIALISRHVNYSMASAGNISMQKPSFARNRKRPVGCPWIIAFFQISERVEHYFLPCLCIEIWSVLQRKSNPKQTNWWYTTRASVSARLAYIWILRLYGPYLWKSEIQMDHPIASALLGDGASFHMNIPTSIKHYQISLPPTLWKLCREKFFHTIYEYLLICLKS